MILERIEVGELDVAFEAQKDSACDEQELGAPPVVHRCVARAYISYVAARSREGRGAHVNCQRFR